MPIIHSIPLTPLTDKELEALTYLFENAGVLGKNWRGFPTEKQNKSDGELFKMALGFGLSNRRYILPHLRRAQVYEMYRLFCAFADRANDKHNHDDTLSTIDSTIDRIKIILPPTSCASQTCCWLKSRSISVAV